MRIVFPAFALAAFAPAVFAQLDSQISASSSNLLAVAAEPELAVLASNASPATVVARGQHFKTYERLRVGTNGMVVTNRYTLMRNGLHWRDALSNWVESVPVVQRFPSAIVCTGVSYQVILSTNLNSVGAVDLLTVDQQRIISHPVGIALYDPASGSNVWLALVKDCAAVVSSNRIIYPDAFAGSGISAAITYYYDVGRFSQSLTFQTQPSVTPTNFGMGGRARLEVISELVQFPPPSSTVQYLYQESDPSVRAKMFNPDVVDETPKFGSQMEMRLGRGFPTSPTGHRPVGLGVPVAKRLVTTADNRTALVESVAWQAVAGELSKLPQPVNGAGQTNLPASAKLNLPNGPVAPAGSLGLRGARASDSFASRLVALTRLQPATLFALSAPRSAPLAHGQALSLPTGFMVDYELVESASNFEFLPGVTYLIDGYVALSGTTTFEYTPIIKFAGSYPSLHLSGSINNYGAGGTFTSVYDNSVGDEIDDYDCYGVAGWCSGGELCFDNLSGSAYFGVVDFRNGIYGFYIAAGSGYYVEIQQASFQNDGYGVYAGGGGSVVLDSVYACGNYGLYQEVTPGMVYIGSYSDCDGEDSDGNGLPNWWQIQYFHHLGVDPSADVDGDDLTNLQEYQLGTDPTKQDTNGDGVIDQAFKITITRPRSGGILP